MFWNIKWFLTSVVKELSSILHSCRYLWNVVTFHYLVRTCNCIRNPLTTLCHLSIIELLQKLQQLIWKPICSSRYVAPCSRLFRQIIANLHWLFTQSRPCLPFAPSGQFADHPVIDSAEWPRVYLSRHKTQTANAHVSNEEKLLNIYAHRRTQMRKINTGTLLARSR